MTRSALPSLILCAAAASLAKGQGPPAPRWSGPIPPAIAVVALDTGLDQRSARIAALTAARLERITTRRELDLVSDWLVRAALEQPEARERTSHDDHREIAKLVRAAALVDVMVLERRTLVARAIVHYASSTSSPDTSPLFVGRGDGDIARQLASHLLRVTVPRATRMIYGKEWRSIGCTAGRGPFEWYEVDEPASLIGSGSARPIPSRSGMFGARSHPPRFAATFVIGESGRVVPGSLELAAVPSPAAADSARAAAERWRFRPARLAGCVVRQLVPEAHLVSSDDLPDTLLTREADLAGRVERVTLQEGFMPGGYKSQLVMWVAIPPSTVANAGIIMGRPGPVFVQHRGQHPIRIDRDSIRVGDHIKVWRSGGAGFGSMQAPPDAPAYGAVQVVIVR